MPSYFSKRKEYLPRLNNFFKVQSKLVREVSKPRLYYNAFPGITLEEAIGGIRKDGRVNKRPKNYSPKIIMFKKNANTMRNSK